MANNDIYCVTSTVNGNNLTSGPDPTVIDYLGSQKPFPSNAFREGKLNEVLFCDEFVEHYPLFYSDYKFYGINGEISEDYLKNQVYMILSKVITRGISRTCDIITSTLRKKCWCEKESYINISKIDLKNGTLCTDGSFNSTLKPTTGRLNVNYNLDLLKQGADKEPTVFLGYLNDLLLPTDILTLQEYLGYCLVPCTKAQKMLFIIGNGGEGKSRLKVILYDIFKDAMIAGHLEDIDGNKYFTANLCGKLLMIDDDITLSALKNTSNLKIIVTAEGPVVVEPKGKPDIQTILFSRFLCFGNEPPKALYDKSDGFTRRLIILTAKPRPANRVNDPYLAEKCIEEKEKILLWMFEGLQRLIKNNYQFTISDEAKASIIEVGEESCNIPAFLEDEHYISLNPNESTSSKALYEAYKQWCNGNLLTVLSNATFAKWLKNNEQKYNIKYSKNIKVDKSIVRGYKGIALLKPTISMDLL